MFLPSSPQYADETTERDAELVIVGKECLNSNYPCIVTGDLNDVAWSYTTRLFQKISRLLDPGKGRGFYNTFHAGHLLLRFPLDHVFHSVSLQSCKIRQTGQHRLRPFPYLRRAELKADYKQSYDDPLPEGEDMETAGDKVFRAT